MSFLLDPPLLLLSGLAIYLLGKRMNWSRHAKIVVGLAIALIFISFSVLLYLDIVRCTFPFFSPQSGSSFMFHSNITHITKAMVPKIIVLLMFLLYPFWIFAGYAIPLLLEKKRRISSEIYTYSDVKSKKKIEEKADGNSIPSPDEEMPGQLDSSTRSNYSVARGKDPKECVRLAIEKLGGIKKFVENGDRVLVKVNICGGVPEKKGTFTSIEVADALTDLIREAGGEPFFADADMVWTKFWQAAKDSGYVKWASEKKVRLVNLSETKIVHFNFGDESAVGVEKVSMELIDADVIISAPTMKTHLLTGVTLAMKNMYGTFPDIDKAKFHKKSIEDTILEVNTAFTPNLVVIDGSIGGEAVGPLSVTPLYYETIIASNDVVMADSIACQMIGYRPMDIVHIKMASDAGLGDATAVFDFKSLPYSHAGGKDGNWQRPDPLVKDFYEWGIELILMFPGWETLFNIGADFILYDTARLPVFKYMVPALLQALHDFIYLNLRGIKSTAGDITRRVINVMLVGLVALGCAVGYYQDGYIWKSSLLFEVSYILAIIIAALASARMKTVHTIMLMVMSSIACYLVESTNIASSLLTYSGSSNVTVFTISGWIVMMMVILQLSDFLAAWLRRLNIFTEISGWRLLPAALTMAAFAAFYYLEGYSGISTPKVQIMYVIIAALGILYSWKHTIEWNAALMIISIATGGYMELIGSLAGFWNYAHHETLAVFFALSWAMNTLLVHGATYLLGVDLGDSEVRSLLPKKPESGHRRIHGTGTMSKECKEGTQ